MIRPSIFIVEDETLIQMMIVEMLEELLSGLIALEHDDSLGVHGGRL